MMDGYVYMPPLMERFTYQFYLVDLKLLIQMEMNKDVQPGI